MRDILLTAIVLPFILDSAGPAFRRHFVIYLARFLLPAELYLRFCPNLSIFTIRGHRHNSRVLVREGEEISPHQGDNLVAVPVGHIRVFQFVCHISR